MADEYIQPPPPVLSPTGERLPSPVATAPPPPKVAQEYKDGSREIVETVVFVVVLVLLLKTFLAEAFVIPTGSMATTLLGYHKKVTCEECGYPFTANASDETGENGPPQNVVSCFCPNCRYLNILRPRQLEGGQP